MNLFRGNERLWAVSWWLGRATVSAAQQKGGSRNTKTQQLQKKWERAMQGKSSQDLRNTAGKVPSKPSSSCSSSGIFSSLSWGRSCRLSGYFSSCFSHHTDCFPDSLTTLDIFHFQNRLAFHYFCLHFLLVHMDFMHISGCFSYDMWKYLYLFPASNLATWHIDYCSGCFQSLLQRLYGQASWS